MYYRDSTRQIGRSPKLNPHKYVGPCVVTKKHSDLLFEICSKQKGKRRVLHHNRLKPYLSDEIPDWVRKLQRRCRDEMGNGDPVTAVQEEGATRAATRKQHGKRGVPKEVQKDADTRRSDRARNPPQYYGV